MSVHFFRLIQIFRASYWFLPSVMAFLAIVLGALMVWLDVGPATGLLDGLGWYQKAKPDGAREVLSTIAGSMITVAGVVFSITIVAIAYAASQYGPRILTNFMSDRGNQVTLGTFIATFVYCLVVLRTIRAGDEGGFVPQIAIMVGLFLALCSIAVLIFFIHHVPNSIHINNVVAHIGKQLVHSVEKRFPAQIGDPPDRDDHPGEDSVAAERALEEGTDAAVIRANRNGYIAVVDDEALLDAARHRDLVFRLHQNPGDFLFKGSVLASAWPASRVDDDTKAAVRGSYTIGNNRTPAQDVFFLIDELVEIAARALSPGVNDPYTAITCLDWLGAAMSDIACRQMPSACRVDRDGALRVIAIPRRFADFVERGFGRMRQYVAGDMNATLHALETLAAIAARCSAKDRLQPLSAEAGRLHELAQQELRGPSAARVTERYGELAGKFAPARDPSA